MNDEHPFTRWRQYTYLVIEHLTERLSKESYPEEVWLRDGDKERFYDLIATIDKYLAEE